MANFKSLPLCVLAGVIFCASAAMAQNAAPAVRIVNPIDETQLVMLKGTVHPLANAKNDRGTAPDNLQLQRMHLVLKRSDTQEASLRQLINDMHTPGTASYHKWLTPDQFGAQFGPSDQDIATVTAWLSSHGFNVTKVNPGKQTLEFSGNAAQLRSAFHTQIHQYQVNGETHYANATDPQIPVALASVVSGFASLNNFRFRNYNHYLGRATYDPRTDKAKPLWTIGSGAFDYQNYNFVLAPQDFAVQYDLNPLYNAGITGAGQTIAIINDSNINIDLVNQFRSVFGLSNNPPQVIIDGNDPGVDGINNPGGPNYDSSEAYIDVEWSGAVAPAATIDLVVGADTALENGLELAMEHAVYSNVAPVMSLSFGACEANLGIYNQFFNQLWEQAAAQGITVMVSTGDAGSAVCDDPNSSSYAVNGQAVSGFASTPFNVAVGGTDFYYSKYNQGSTAIDTQLGTYWNTTAANSTPGLSIKGVIPEQPWNDSQYGLNLFNAYADSGGTATTIAGGSGGASNCATGTAANPLNGWTACTAGYPKPSWQTAAASIGVPADGVRDLPDVSLFAANGYNDSYYPVCANDGDCQPASSATGGYVQISGYGGTSVSSPAFAGIMALVNQKYGPQGQADFVLYPLAHQFPSAFHDVTVGTNSMPCEFSPTLSTDCIAVAGGGDVVGTVTEGQIGTGTTPEYNANPAGGYNLATGIGTVDANVLVNDWNRVRFTASHTSLTVTPANSAPLNAIPHGTAVAISGTVTPGTAGGSVALVTDSIENSQQGQGLAPVLNGFGYAYGGSFGSGIFPVTSGAYSGSVSTLPGGTYDIWASYSGDGTNGMSTSSPVQITVTQEASGIDFQAITPNGNTPAGKTISGTVDYGTQFELSAQITPSSQLSNFETCTTSCPVFTLPTGTVTFKDGSTSINTAVLNAEGDAEYNAPFAVGNHSVTASYSGDNSYNPAPATSPIVFTVAQDTPDLLVGASNLTGASGFQVLGGAGQPTVIGLILENDAQFNSGKPAPASPPTGSVTATGSLPAGMNASTTLVEGIDPITGGQAGIGTFTIPASTAAGSYNVTFKYQGDANYKSISGSGTIQIVGQSGLASTTTATMSGGVSPNSNILVTGSVTGQSGHGAPTGGIFVFSSGDCINNCNSINFSSTSGVTSNFAFTLDSRTLLQGGNVVTVQYVGDSTYNESAFTLNTGSPITNPISDFTMVPVTTIVPVTAGSSGTVTINLGSVNGFSGNVGLTCQASAGVTCSIPSSAGLSSGGSATATLTINAGTFTPDLNYNVKVTGTDSTGEFIHTLAIKAQVSGSTAGSASFALINSGNITTDPGATTGNTSTITVTPLGNFTGSVALTCAVTPTTGASLPTCSFSPNPVPLTPTAALNSTLTINTTSTTTPGSYTVVVTGSVGAITPTTTLTVSVGAPSFSLANNGPITIATTGETSGNSATITVTPTNGFTGPVSLSCVVTGIPTNANDPGTCAWSTGGTTTSVTISGTAPQTATLVLNTTAATSMNQPMKLFWPSTGGAVLATLLFFVVPRRRRNWLMMVGLLALFISSAAIGCGGGSGGGGGGGGGTKNPGTTTGQYTVTVTATGGSVTPSPTTAVTFNVN